MATEFYVNASTGNDTTNDCLTPATACQTITGALAATKAEDPGDIVHIADGTYAEDVSVNKGQSLVAQGLGAAITGAVCAGPTLSIDLATASASAQGLTIRSTCAGQPAISIVNSLLGAPTATLSRVQVVATQNGVNVGTGLTLAIDNSTISSGADGIAATGAGPITASNVTIQGMPDISLASTTLTLDSSILAGTGIAGTGTCSISYSRGSSSTCGGFQTNASPGFAAGGFDLAAGSPMIDAGNPTPSGSGVDLFGRPRYQDGNADCSAIRDIGAAEFQPTSAECNIPGNTSARKHGLFEVFGISSPVNIGSYLLCVDGPGKRQCKRFKAKKSSSVNWSRAFRYRGQGHYTVDWLTSNGRRALGPQQQFDWGPCAPGNLSMKGIWKPHRLIVIDRCREATFIVNGSFRSRGDGDYHIKVNPTGDTPNGMKTYEIIPRDQPRHIPRLRGGRRFRVWGVYVCDTFHGPLGHTEIHPAFKVQQLANNSNNVVKEYLSGPQYPGTPNVNLTPKGRFHCRNT